MKVSERHLEPAKTSKKGIFHNHQETSSFPQDQKVTKSSHSRLRNDVFLQKTSKKPKIVKKNRKIFSIFFTSVSCKVPKKLKVAIYARKTLLFLLKIDGMSLVSE